MNNILLKVKEDMEENMCYIGDDCEVIDNKLIFTGGVFPYKVIDLLNYVDTYTGVDELLDELNLKIVFACDLMCDFPSVTIALEKITFKNKK